MALRHKDAANVGPAGESPPVAWPREAAEVLVAWMAGAAVFFRGPIFSGFDRINGGDGDVRLIALLHEHWIDVVRGRAPWQTPSFFHPTTGTLGYSDTFVINEVFYAPLRVVGLDRYAALQVTLMLLTLVGFVGYHLVGTRLVRAPRWLSLSMSLTAVFANSLFVQIDHPQMMSIHWLPWLVLLVAAACRARTRRGQLVAAGAAGLLFGLLTWSTYYVAWFAAFTGGLFLLGVAVQMRERLRAAGVRRLAARLWQPLVAAAAGAAVPVAGFLFTYVPALRATGGRSFDDAFYYSPAPADLVNVSGGNFFWGGTVRSWLGTARVNNAELGSAVTPLVTVAVVVLAVLLFRRLRGDRGLAAQVARVTLVLAALLPLLTVHVGGTTLWRVVWFVPGSSGIRTIGRLQLVAAYLAPLAIMCALTCLRRANPAPRAGRWWRAAVVAGALVLPLEQWNTRPSANLDRRAELDRIAGTPAPPAECESFFLLPVPDRYHYAMSLDAMLIAQRYRLPTVNGYSGAQPPEWAVRQDRGDYFDSLRAWVDLHDLQHVCSYEETTRVWTLDGVPPG